MECILYHLGLICIQKKILDIISSKKNLIYYKTNKLNEVNDWFVLVTKNGEQKVYAIEFFSCFLV